MGFRYGIYRLNYMSCWIKASKLQIFIFEFFCHILQCASNLLLNVFFLFCWTIPFAIAHNFFYFLWQINCNLWRGQNCYYSIYFQSDHSNFSLFFIMEKGLMKWGIKGPQFPLTSSFHVFVKEKKNVIIALELQTRVYEKLLLHPQKNRKNPF